MCFFNCPSLSSRPHRPLSGRRRQRRFRFLILDGNEEEEEERVIWMGGSEIGMTGSGLESLDLGLATGF